MSAVENRVEIMQIMRRIEQDGKVRWLMRKNYKHRTFTQITAAEAKRLLISNEAEQLPDMNAGRSQTINI
jgi:hypothetical protein